MARVKVAVPVPVDGVFEYGEVPWLGRFPMRLKNSPWRSPDELCRSDGVV